jgi:acyl phosphate:glycerol-3-phosphate acyltransferase
VSVFLLTCLAFVLGSFPSGVVLSRLLTGQDVRRMGSGNIGAANVVRTSGFKTGASVALLDIAKGVLPVLFGKQAGLGHTALALVALAAVLGHDFSLFLRFRGGKGVATTLGVAVVLAPLGTLLAAAAWVLTLLLRGYPSLASLVALGLLPILVGLTGGPPAYVVLASALFVLGAGKHWVNIVRLAHGRESGLRRRPGAE